MSQHNITTQFIAQHVEEAIAAFENDTSKSARVFRRTEMQLLLEREWLETREPKPAKKCMLNHLAGLEPESLTSLLSSHFCNFEVLEAASHVISLIVSRSGRLQVNERLRAYFNDVHRIGVASRVAYAVTGAIGLKRGANKSDAFIVVKVPHEPTPIDCDELTHECALGVFGTNTMRKLVPNFAYILGFQQMECAYLEDKVTWPVENAEQGATINTVPWVFYEHIRGSRSIAEPGQSLEEFMSAFLQTLCAIQLAYEHIEFTHFDLHKHNVLRRIVDVPNGTYIAYPMAKKTLYVEVRGSVATIIDFGRCHAKIVNPRVDSRNSLVRIGKPSRNVYSLRHGNTGKAANPIADAYKLLCTCLVVFRRHSGALFNRLRGLLEFFNPSEEPEYILKHQAKYYYGLPMVPEVRKIALLDFIEYCRKFAESSLVIEYRPERLLGANTELSYQQALSRFHGSSSLTFLEFYELVGSSSGCVENHFDVNLAFERERETIRELSAILSRRASKTTSIVRRMDEAMEYVDAYQKHATCLKIGLFVAEATNSKHIVAFYEATKREHAEAKKRLVCLLDQMRNDIKEVAFESRYAHDLKILEKLVASQA